MPSHPITSPSTDPPVEGSERPTAQQSSTSSSSHVGDADGSIHQKSSSTSSAGGASPTTARTNATYDPKSATKPTSGPRTTTSGRSQASRPNFIDIRTPSATASLVQPLPSPGRSSHPYLPTSQRHIHTHSHSKSGNTGMVTGAGAGAGGGGDPDYSSAASTSKATTSSVNRTAFAPNPSPPFSNPYQPFSWGQSDNSGNDMASSSTSDVVTPMPGRYDFGSNFDGSEMAGANPTAALPGDLSPPSSSSLPSPVPGSHPSHVPHSTLSFTSKQGQPINPTASIPMLSFLASYPHPAFLLPALPLDEGLRKRLAVIKTKDPEEEAQSNPEGHTFNLMGDIGNKVDSSMIVGGTGARGRAGAGLGGGPTSGSNSGHEGYRVGAGSSSTPSSSGTTVGGKRSFSQRDGVKVVGRSLSRKSQEGDKGKGKGIGFDGGDDGREGDQGMMVVDDEDDEVEDSVGVDGDQNAAAAAAGTTSETGVEGVLLGLRLRKAFADERSPSKGGTGGGTLTTTRSAPTPPRSQPLPLPTITERSRTLPDLPSSSATSATTITRRSSGTVVERRDPFENTSPMEECKDAVIDRARIEAWESGTQQGESTGQSPATLVGEAPALQYPGVVGAEADRGLSHSLSDLLTSVWSNEAYEDLMAFVNTGDWSYDRGAPCLINLLGAKEGLQLTTFLRDCLDEYESNLLASTDLGSNADRRRAPSGSEKTKSLRVRLKLPGHAKEEAPTTARSPELEMTATIVRSTSPLSPAPVGSIPMSTIFGRDCFVVITTVAHNIPDSPRRSTRSLSVQDPGPNREFSVATGVSSQPTEFPLLDSPPAVSSPQPASGKDGVASFPFFPPKPVHKFQRPSISPAQRDSNSSLGSSRGSSNSVILPGAGGSSETYSSITTVLSDDLSSPSSVQGSTVPSIHPPASSRVPLPIPMKMPEGFILERRLRGDRKDAKLSRSEGGRKYKGANRSGMFSAGAENSQRMALESIGEPAGWSGEESATETTEGEDDVMGAEEEENPSLAVSSPPSRSKSKQKIANSVAMDWIASSADADRPNSIPISPNESPGDQVGVRPPTDASFGPPPTFANSEDPFLRSIGGTSMGVMIATYPWHMTPLGPISQWDTVLKSSVCQMLASPFRTGLWWGEDCVLLYNDEYLKTAGKKHPFLLGKSGAEAWAELWDNLGPLAERVRGGETIANYDNLLFMHRRPDNAHGIMREETYHTWAFIPVRSGDGAYVAGFMNPSFETTSRVIAERRLGTLRDIAQMTGLARTTEDYCRSVLGSLHKNPYDIPFAVLYSCSIEHGTLRGDPQKRPETSSHVTPSLTMKLRLEGTIGVPEGHSSAPLDLSLNIEGDPQFLAQISSSSGASSSTATLSFTQDDSLVWPLQEACTKRKPIFIPILGNRADGFEERGWAEPTTSGVVIPIANEDQLPTAVFVLGLSPRLPWNETQAIFLQLLARQIATGLSTVRNYEEEVAKAAELGALDRAKTTFYSSTSHELRTPLTLILGPLQDLLAESNLPSEARDRLKVVNRNAQRLLTLVNSLLDFSRLEAGRMVATYRPVRFGPFTADLASLFRSAIERGKIEYIVNCPDDARAVWLDIDLWEKIVFNIIGNAFKYSPDPGGKIVVSTRILPTNEALFSVSDTGCGIPESDIGKIFDRFHRVQSSGRSHEGTGIGLALTLELVKLHGGKLEVESEVGRGSTFKVKIPMGNTHLPRDRLEESPLPNDGEIPVRAAYGMAIVQEAASWNSSPEEGQLTSPSSGASSSAPSETGSLMGFAADAMDALSIRGSRILLADDNADMRRYCKSILSRMGMAVVDVPDGRAALDYAQTHPADLIITDVMMPHMDGFELVRRLRADASTALIPIIVLSARAGPEASVEHLMQGADDHLGKPFQAKELMARVSTHLQLGKMRRELEKRVLERTRDLVDSELRYRNLAQKYSEVMLLSPVGIFAWDMNGTITFTNPKWQEIAGQPGNITFYEWLEQAAVEDRETVCQKWRECHERRIPVTFEYRWGSSGRWYQGEIRPHIDEGTRTLAFVGSITDIDERKTIEQLHLQNVEQRAIDAENTRRQLEIFVDVTSHEMRNPLSGIWQNAELLGNSLERFTELLETLRKSQMPEQNSIDDLAQELDQDVDAVDSILLCASHQGRIADDILNVSKLSMGLLTLQPIDFDLCAKAAETVKMYELEAQQKQIHLTLSIGPSIAQLGIDWIRADPNRLAQVLINFLTNAVRFTATAATRTVDVRLDAYRSMPAPSSVALRVLHPEEPEDRPENLWIVMAVADSGRGLSSEERSRLFERFSQANPKTDQFGGSGLGLFVSKKLIQLYGGFIELESMMGKGSTFRFGFPTVRGHAPAGGVTPVTSFRAKRFLGRTARLRRPSAPVSSKPSVEGPMARGQPAGEDTAMQLAGAGQASSSGTRSGTIAVDVPLKEKKSQKVLIVEDNVINQKVLQRQLKLHAYTVTIANNGAEALDIIFADDDAAGKAGPGQKIDVILMDIEMPVKDGLTAIKELREAERSGRLSRHHPCIAVTGNARPGQIENCLRAGFDDVAIKPYRLQELLPLIDIVVEGGGRGRLGNFPGATARLPIPTSNPMARLSSAPSSSVNDTAMSTSP